MLKDLHVVSEAGDNLTLHDGTLVFHTRRFAALRSFVGMTSDVKVTQQDIVNGFYLMLPDWLSSLAGGLTVYDVSRMINEVNHRQYVSSTAGFNSWDRQQTRMVEKRNDAVSVNANSFDENRLASEIVRFLYL